MAFSAFADSTAIEKSSYLVRELEPLEPYLDRRDSRVIDIQINRPGGMFLEVDGKDDYEYVADQRITVDWVERLCKVLANLTKRQFTLEQPYIKCSLPGGHRFTGLMGPSVPDGGMAVSIRVKRRVEISLVQYGLGEAQIEDLRKLVAHGRPVLISGGMGTGKTTFLNCLLKFMPARRRTILIEDVQELDLDTPNYVRLELDTAGGEGRLNWAAAINLSMRLNGQSFVCSELNVENALPMVRVMTSGHSSFMMTCHANSPAEAIMAWGSNYEMSSGHPAGPMIRRVARVLDEGAIIQLERVPGGGRRVTELVSANQIAGIQHILKETT
ncbi:ATPase, T2SS/T4P/T4SS family [Azospirillum sp. B4]|uniref:ATPase, T2SS/T4P/T4SS family n=1 Tax=Azospirillum sp. B4 TaxID=95605 RepID=UPI00034867B5|nr:ATPase, T2SS/T4P/T4SS family [Azospirillum sp. B4]